MSTITETFTPPQQECPHDVIFANLCANCGKVVESKATSTMHLGHPKLAVSNREAERIEIETANRLRAQKKLSLVLDLDHTLIHATTEFVVKQLPQVDLLHDVTEFVLPNDKTRYFVKLRPGLREFLQELRNLYEFHIYTMGTRSYALKIAEIIDVDSVFFQPTKIISRSDCADMNYKNLKRLFPCDDSMVLILDDREDVWINPTTQQVSPNLIKIEPFHYFETKEELNALPQDKMKQKQVNKNNTNSSELNQQAQHLPEKGGQIGNDHKTGTDNDDTPPGDTYLSCMKTILKTVHQKFYSSRAEDVKDVLQSMRKSVLSGCHLVFSGLIPLHRDDRTADIWRLAEAFGAKCDKELSSFVTHLVAAKPGTEKVTKVLATPGIYLVNADWLYDCVRTWRRCDEFSYSVGGLPVLRDGNGNRRPRDPNNNSDAETNQSEPERMFDSDRPQKKARTGESPQENGTTKEIQMKDGETNNNEEDEDLELLNLIEQELEDER